MKAAQDQAKAVMTRLKLDEAALATRKAFLGFTDIDLAHLSKLHEALRETSPEFAESFYDHLLRFPETRRFIPDERVLGRLRQAQAAYFATLTAGNYGSDYIRQRLQVGIMHQRIGLETQWYLGAYAKYLVDLLPEIWQRLDGKEERLAAIQALIKIVFFDMGLAIDTYIEADRHAIRTLNEYADMVFASIPVGLLVLSRELVILSANPAFLKLFGLDAQAILNCHLMEVVAAEGLEARARDVLEGGSAQYHATLPMGTAGKPSEPVRLTLTGIRLAEEEARLLMIVEDIAKEVRLQLALEESEATLLRAQEVAHIGSWYLDFFSGALVWSPAVYRIFGLPPDTALDYERFLACIYPEDRERVDAAWQAALAGAPYHLQHRIVADGETRWVEERAEIEFDGEHRPIKAVGTVQDITDRKAAEKRIETLAFYDPLTRLPNRALFMDRLRHELAAAERRGQRLALLFLDLDRFKDINDTLGHDAGDRVLVEVARRFREALREEETLARLSGDEFVIMASMASDSGKAAVRIAERIAEALATPIAVGDQGFSVSTSIGIAIFPEDGKSTEALLKHADIAMYRAKGAGGGYRFYCAEMGEELARRLGVAQRLEKALLAGQLQLHYQPQVNLASGVLVGAEALARWTDPEWGAVSPADFIPIAEERGLIVSLGEWALAGACGQVRKWETDGRPMCGRIAVNISARQFDDDGLVDTAIRIAKENGVPPARIELELTESGMMRDPERAVEVAQALAAAGFSLSIDDFGTGHSSLSYLKRFPVNRLKIDMSFVRDMLTDHNDRSIVSAIIAMGRSLELETLAEGIEHVRQAEALLALGCHYAQGYHFGRPLAADDFAKAWLHGTGS